MRGGFSLKGTRLMTFAPANAVVWTEIPVLDLDRGIAFYKEVFGHALDRDDSGPNPMAMFSTSDPVNGVAGHLYPGKPAQGGNGPTVHLQVPDSLEASAERCERAGGTILSEPIGIPAGRFQYATDPDGNSIGLFEPTKG